MLDLQELDSKLDALRHQIASMPEHAELTALSQSKGEVDTEVRDHQVVVEDLTRDQKKADADVEQVKARRLRDQQRLDSGQVGNPKDLERLQHELVSLDKRISDLEDVELEVMEALETAQQALDAKRAELADINARGSALLKARDTKAATWQAEAARVAEDRAIMASGIPADLLALYEKLRESKGGVAVSALLQRRCGGCGLELSPADIGAVRQKSVDDIVRCEECARILVRTAESGL